MPKKHSKRSSQIITFHFIKRNPTQLLGVACSLYNAGFDVYKVVDDDIVVFDFALFIQINVVYNTNQSWVLDVKASFFFGFPNDCYFKALAKFNQAAGYGPFALAGFVASFYQCYFAFLYYDCADAYYWLVRV